MSVTARIGQLRHRVTIQENTPSVDSYGVRSESWATVEKVYARVEPISAAEYLRADRDTMNVTHKITMRYRSDLGSSDTTISPRHRLSYDNRTFEPVHVVDVDERHRWLQVLAHEVV